VTLYRGRGCPACHNTGYLGRTGIFEILQVTEPLRSLINQNVPDSTIRRGAIEDGMRTIGEDGLHKVMEGHTTLEEVTRVVYLAEQGAKICPSCKTVLSQEFEYCPACGEFVGENCKHCRRRLDPEWKHCPGCGAITGHGESSTSAAARRSALGRTTPRALSSWRRDSDVFSMTERAKMRPSSAAPTAPTGRRGRAPLSVIRKAS